MNRAEPKMQLLCTRTRFSFHRRAARSRGNNPQYQWAGENCQTYAVELGSQANYINVGKCTSILFSFCVSNPNLTDQPFFNAQELASRNWGLGLDDGGDGDDDSLFSIDSTKRSAKHEQKHWQLKSCLESGLSSMWILKSIRLPIHLIPPWHDFFIYEFVYFVIEFKDVEVVDTSFLRLPNGLFGPSTKRVSYKVLVVNV